MLWRRGVTLGRQLSAAEAVAIGTNSADSTSRGRGNSPSLEEIWWCLTVSTTVRLRCRCIYALSSPPSPGLPSSLLSIFPPLLPPFHASNKLFIERLPSARHYLVEKMSWNKILHVIYLQLFKCSKGPYQVRKEWGEPTESWYLENEHWRMN